MQRNNNNNNNNYYNKIINENITSKTLGNHLPNKIFILKSIIILFFITILKTPNYKLHYTPFDFLNQIELVSSKPS